MSKRFFDTEVFLRPWFRQLNPRLKCLWLYFLSRCDLAGVIDMDWELASFSIGSKVSPEDLKEMNGNIVKLESGKYFIPGFISFQYGQLKDHSNPHKAVLKAMAANGIEYIDGNPRVDQGLAKGCLTLLDQDQDKDQDKDQDQDKDCKAKSGDMGYDSLFSQNLIPEPLAHDSFKAAWTLWDAHRKEKKKPLTLTSVKMQLKDLERMGRHGAIKAIEHSISNGWQGIFSPNQQKTQASQASNI